MWLEKVLKWYVYLELLHGIPQMKVFIYDSFVAYPVVLVEIASYSLPISHFITLRSSERFSFWVWGGR